MKSPDKKAANEPDLFSSFEADYWYDPEVLRDNLRKKLNTFTEPPTEDEKNILRNIIKNLEDIDDSQLVRIKRHNGTFTLEFSPRAIRELD